MRSGQYSRLYTPAVAAPRVVVGLQLKANKEDGRERKYTEFTDTRYLTSKSESIVSTASGDIHTHNAFLHSVVARGFHKWSQSR